MSLAAPAAASRATCVKFLSQQGDGRHFAFVVTHDTLDRNPNFDLSAARF